MIQQHGLRHSSSAPRHLQPAHSRLCQGQENSKLERQRAAIAAECLQLGLLPAAAKSRVLPVFSLQVWVENLSASNHTYLNNEVLSENRVLEHMDVIELGGRKFRFELPDARTAEVFAMCPDGRRASTIN